MTVERVVTSRPSWVDWLFRFLAVLAAVLYMAMVADLFIVARQPYIPTITPFPIRVILGLLGGGLGIAISALILWRVPGNAVGRLLLLWTIAVIGFQFSYNFGRPEIEPAAFLIFIFYFSAVGITAFVLLLFYFPTGQVYPPGLTIFVPVFIVLRLVGSLLFVMGTDPATFNLANNPFPVPSLTSYTNILVATIGYIGALSLAIGTMIGTYSLVVRYRNASSGEQQQIKWFAWAGIIITILLLVFVVTHVVIADDFAELLPVTDFPLFVLVAILPSIAIGAAVLRYGLWDIDFLINRTLVYTIVTGALVATYFVSAIAIQRVLGKVASEQSPVAIVGSTLLIAALFQPLRRQVQAIIDQRFYRGKYDAQRLLERFGIELRDEVDSEAVAKLLLDVVQESLQPRESSLWIVRRR